MDGYVLVCLNKKLRLPPRCRPNYFTPHPAPGSEMTLYTRAMAAYQRRYYTDMHRAISQKRPTADRKLACYGKLPFPLGGFRG